MFGLPFAQEIKSHIQICVQSINKYRMTINHNQDVNSKVVSTLKSKQFRWKSERDT